MAKIKVFFAGPRKGIEVERGLARSLLEEMQADGSLDVIAFDAGTVSPAATDATAYLDKLARCEAVIFALGDDPGTIFDGSRAGEVTTWTLEEWRLAIKIGVPIYLILKHPLDKKFRESQSDRKARSIWKFLSESIPTKKRIQFNPKQKGSLRDAVSRVVAKILSDKVALTEAADRWVDEASKKLIDRLTSKNTAAEMNKAVTEITSSVSPEADPNIVRLIAAASVLRRFSETPDEVSAFVDRWLDRAYVLLTETQHETSTLVTRADQGLPIRRKDVVDRWLPAFRSLPDWKKYLIVRCLLEKGLARRYLWDFEGESEIEGWADSLAVSVAWKGLGSLRDRFYEVYLGALAYAGHSSALTERRDEIFKLRLSGPEGEGRRLQLVGLANFVLGDHPGGISAYKDAVSQFEIEGDNWLKNIAHSYVMIAAMSGDEKTADQIVNIKDHYQKIIEDRTKLKIDAALNSFYWRVWNNIERGQFALIWKP